MIAVWFSNGAPSACALKMTIEKYGLHNVRALNNPVAEEHEDNLRFADDVSRWCGIEIEKVRSRRYPSGKATEVWEDRKAMSFPLGAPCTDFLKKRARQDWENENKPDWHVFGFTLEEKSRHTRFVTTERENVIPVLIEAGMTREMCSKMLNEAGIKLPQAYSLGLPNANCLGCVKSTSPTYWNLIRRISPQVFEQRAEQSRRLGVRLVRVKGERLFLDQLDPNATGRPLKSMPECSILCEEKPQDTNADLDDEFGGVL